MANTYLSRTPSSAGNRKTWTFSVWLKRSTIGTAQRIFSQGDHSSGDPMTFLAFKSDDTLQFNRYSGGSTELVTNRLFRDTSAWYHIVFRCDTTNATAGDRLRLYINGVEETSFATDNNPSLNSNTEVNNTQKIEIGRVEAVQYFDGQMAHVHLIDGTAYDASAFGETDSTTGIWKPKTAPSVTYGTNGFFLKFENSGAFGTDSSGNGNTFTVNGTMTQTIDTPSNVFATFNPLIPTATTLSVGNTKVTYSSGWESVLSTLAVSQGKYYFEIKVDTLGTASQIGIVDISQFANSAFPGNLSRGYSYDQVGDVYNNATKIFDPYGDSYTSGDIIMVAMDLDNSKLYFGKNGTWQNSSDPTSGATGTGAVSISSGYDYTPATSPYAGTHSVNFGNGYFGTTAVSSAQNPDDGIGIFEYDVPTGYRALCTKSINAEEYS